MWLYFPHITHLNQLRSSTISYLWLSKIKKEVTTAVSASEVSHLLHYSFLWYLTVSIKGHYCVLSPMIMSGLIIDKQVC